MTERLRTTLLIVAILLASAAVTVTTWAGLRVVTSPGHTPQRSAPVANPGPPIQARLLPVIVGAPAAGAAPATH
jgi:hypothetical protein